MLIMPSIAKAFLILDSNYKGIFSCPCWCACSALPTGAVMVPEGWVMCLIRAVDEWPTGSWDVTEPGALHAEAHACTWLLQLGLCRANPEGREGSISAALMYCFCQKWEAVIFLVRLFDFLISLTVESFDVFFVSVSALSVSVRLIRGSPSL